MSLAPHSDNAESGTRMLGRIGILRACLFLIGAASDAIAGMTSRVSQYIDAKIEEIRGQQIVFFTRGDNLANLNRAVLYVRRNEHTNSEVAPENRTIV